MRKTLVRVTLFVTLFCLTLASAHAASRHEAATRLEDFRRFFVDFQYAPDSGIPGDLLAECAGVIILRQYKAGFVFGAKGGDGVVLLHDRYSGTWSSPAFVRMGEASFGLQIGGQAVDAIILIMNEFGLDMLLDTRFKLGVDASVAAGPVGRDVAASVGAGAAFLTYSRAKGLFAGASFEGGAFLNHDSLNRALYGRPVQVKDILMDRRLAPPPESYPLINTLRSYSVRNTANPNPWAATPRGEYRGDGQGQQAPAGNWADQGRRNDVRNW